MGNKNDLHNLCGIESRLNKSRGNKKFGDNMYDYRLLYDCKISKDLFNPMLGKGNIARTCYYMMKTYGDYIDNDNLIDHETLMRWNYDNPPGYHEKKKNELIFKTQGSYNIYIDDFTKV